jgi:hypothetical protein
MSVQEAVSCPLWAGYLIISGLCGIFALVFWFATAWLCELESPFWTPLLLFCGLWGSICALAHFLLLLAVLIAYFDPNPTNVR